MTKIEAAIKCYQGEKVRLPFWDFHTYIYLGEENGDLIKTNNSSMYHQFDFNGLDCDSEWEIYQEKTEPKYYRMLGDGELIRNGDQYLCTSKEWKIATSYLGKHYIVDVYRPIRRQITELRFEDVADKWITSKDTGSKYKMVYYNKKSREPFGFHVCDFNSEHLLKNYKIPGIMED